MDYTDLENEAQKLSKLCQMINPYEKLGKETKDELFRLGIVNFEDPFAITNELLILLEEVDEKLKKLKH
ncbi:MAG: hypothetical protein ACO20H_04575 [Bacteriovoracaceae bacterium]